MLVVVLFMLFINSKVLSGNLPVAKILTIQPA